MDALRIARMIDHTNLKRDVSKERLLQTIEECKKYHFHTIAVNSYQSKLYKIEDIIKIYKLSSSISSSGI